MRTFHVGGTASAGAQVNKTEVKTAGILILDNVKTCKLPDGKTVIMNKTGELIIKTKQGVEKERYPAVYGATLFFNEGDEVSIGDSIIEWDPFALPILTEATGRIKYEDLVVGKTVNEQVDSVTGLTHKVVVETKDPSYSRRFQLLMNQEMFLRYQVHQEKQFIVYLLGQTLLLTMVMKSQLVSRL